MYTFSVGRCMWDEACVKNTEQEICLMPQLAAYNVAYRLHPNGVHYYQVIMANMNTANTKAAAPGAAVTLLLLLALLAHT